WAGETGILFAARFFLVALVLLPPTVLMGGTLPLFCRQYVRDRDRIARGVGFLYAMNTLGAAVGCALAGFVLLPRLGGSGAILAGGTLSVLAGLVALRLPIDAVEERVESSVSKRTKASAIAFSPRVIGALFFSMGLAALGSDVLWARFLGLLIRNTVYTYTISLTMVLIGIVLGSALAGLWFDRSRDRLAQVFAVSNFLIASSTMLLMTLPAEFWAPWRGQLWIYALVLLPGAIFSGASFPLAIRMVLDRPASAPATVGWMTALNTAGGIAGSLLVGFFLLPRL